MGDFFWRLKGRDDSHEGRSSSVAAVQEEEGGFDKNCGG